MSLYQHGKSWYYDFQYRGERYTGCIGPVSKTVAKEILAKKKAEAVEGRYELPSQKPSPRLEDFAKEYFARTRVLCPFASTSGGDCVAHRISDV